jgi:hypothetical protein
MAEGMFIPDMVEEDDAGIAAEHAPKLTLPLLTAPFPKTDAKLFNTLRRQLVAVACKDVPGAHYAFDSSVLAPASQKNFQKLKGIIDRHPGAPMSIFGHTDAEGDVIYNKHLSERRAEVVHALLIRDVPAWERLFSDHRNTPGDVWGDDAVELMLSALGFTIDGTQNETLRDVIKRFQSGNALGPSGRADKALRAKLFAQYMDFLCVDEKGTPYHLEKSDFLGEGASHGAFQGCSEFNPQLVLAKSEADAFERDKENGKEDRHKANFDNRRAIMYFFEPGTTIDPAKWPCPRASEGIGKCVAHFWSDGNDRRLKQIPEKRRRFGKAVRNHAERIAQIEQTFSCRFYHGLAQHSPCERDLQMWVLRLMMDGTREQGKDKGLLVPVANVRYVALASTEDTAPIIRGTTSSKGIIGLPLWVQTPVMTLKLDLSTAVLGGTPGTAAPATDDEDSPDIDALTAQQRKDRDQKGRVDSDAFADEANFISFSVLGGRLQRIVRKADSAGEPSALEPDAGEPAVDVTEQDLGARQRLHNLGYGKEDPQRWTAAELTQFVTRYQKDKQLKVTGTLDGPTIQQLRTDYGS